MQWPHGYISAWARRSSPPLGSTAWGRSHSAASAIGAAPLGPRRCAPQCWLRRCGVPGGGGFRGVLRCAQRRRLFRSVGALEVLSKRYTLAALSNGNADIRRLGLERIFAFHLNAEGVGAPKPQPAMFEAALRSGAWPGQAVHIGDNAVDDVGCRGLGYQNRMGERRSPRLAPGRRRIGSCPTSRRFWGSSSFGRGLR